MKYSLLDEIGGHFLDKAVELVRKGRKFVFVLDNIDWDVKVNDMRSDNQNKSVHAVATSLVFDRVPSDHLPDCGPQRNLECCDMRRLTSLTDVEKACTRERYKILLARILCEFFPAFRFLSDLVPTHLPCQYQGEMSMRSDVFLGVCGRVVMIMKDTALRAGHSTRSDTHSALPCT